MNNKNKNKITTLKTLLMLSIMSMMLIPGGITPVHAASGDQLLTINNPTPAAGDSFGSSVATTPTGDLLIGAIGDSTGASAAGSVYLYDTHGNLLLTINNPTPAAGDRFGNSVATTPTGDLLIGDFGDDTGASNAGSAYLFDGTNGNLILTINNPTPASSDRFADSVATTPTGDLLVGAVNEDTGASNSGSVYLFEGISLSEILQNANDELQDIIDANPESGLADNLEDCIGSIETAITELEKSPPDNQAAAGNIEGVTGCLEDAIKDNDLDSVTGTQLINEILDVSRQIAVDAINIAENTPGSDSSKIDSANTALDNGDTLRILPTEFGDHKDAAAAYKTAIAEAEGALP